MGKICLKTNAIFAFSDISAHARSGVDNEYKSEFVDFKTRTAHALISMHTYVQADMVMSSSPIIRHGLDMSWLVDPKG